MKKYKWNKGGDFTVTKNDILKMSKNGLQSLYWFIHNEESETLSVNDNDAVSSTNGNLYIDSSTKTVIRNILAAKKVELFTVLSNGKTIAEQNYELRGLSVKELEAVTNLIKSKEYDGTYRRCDTMSEILINYINGKYLYNSYILAEIISRTAELKVQAHGNTIADRIYRVERLLQSEICLMNRHFQLVAVVGDSSLHMKMERLVKLSHTLDLLGRYKDLNILRVEAKMSSDFDNPVSNELVDTRYEEVRREMQSLQSEINILTA